MREILIPVFLRLKNASTTNSDSKVSISGWTYGGYNGVENTPSIDSSLNPENQTVQYTYYTDGACSTQTSTKTEQKQKAGTKECRHLLCKSPRYRNLPIIMPEQQPVH